MSTTVYLAPAPLNVTQFIPGGNVPAAGGLLFCYQAGTSQKQNMFTDNTGVPTWTNPLVLDSGGNQGGEVWIPAGLPAKFVLAPSNDTDPPASPYWSRDNISGINDTTITDSEWIGGPAPTFVSTTSFTLVGDQTLVFTVGRRVKTTNTGGTIYSTISTSAFTSLTTVTVVNDSGALDSGLSAVSYALLSSTSNNSIPHIGTFTATTSVVTPLVTAATGVNLNFGINSVNKWFVEGAAATFAFLPAIDNVFTVGNAGNRVAAAFTPIIDSGTTGSLSLKVDNGETIATFQRIGTTVNNFDFIGAAAAARPLLRVNGSDTNIPFGIGVKGSGSFDFITDILATAPIQFQVLHTSSATRNITVTGSNGGNPTLSTTGGSLSIGALLDVQTVTTAGANTGTLLNCPHTGNPSAWPRISINGSTFCFPCFQTS